MLSKYNLFIIIFIFSGGFILLDYGVNSYAYNLSATKLSTPLTALESQIIAPEPSQSIITPGLLKTADLAELTLTPPVISTNLFNSLTSTDPNIQIWKQTLQVDQKTAVKIYDLTSQTLSWRDIYFKILNDAQNTRQNNISVNASNDFGKNSFYLNDSNLAQITFLCVQLENAVLAFEYPKQNHKIILAIIEQL
jgi:hypothetical protein